MATFIQVGTQRINLDHVIRWNYVHSAELPSIEIVTTELVESRIEDANGEFLGAAAVSQVHMFIGPPAELIYAYFLNRADVYKIF